MKTKSVITIMLITTLLISMIFSSIVFADNITITLDGNNIEFDQPPILQDDTTYVPMRAIFEAMGFKVVWSDYYQYTTVTTPCGQMIVDYYYGYIRYETKFGDKKINVRPIIVNDRTLVPVRAIAEATGYNVAWDEASTTVIITSPVVDAYYPNTNIPDFEACMGVPLPFNEKLGGYWGQVYPNNVRDYVMKYLLMRGFEVNDYKTQMSINSWTSSPVPSITVYKNSSTGDVVELVDFGEGVHYDFLFIYIHDKE